MEKHMDVNHFIIAKSFEKKVNFALRIGVVGTKPTKIKSNVFGSLISKSLITKAVLWKILAF